jgi:hypothetical protein
MAVSTRVRDLEAEVERLHRGIAKWQGKTGETRAEVRRLRRLVKAALDALDAEKVPDFGVGHDRAVAALAEALTGHKPKDQYAGPTVTLDELRARAS